MGSSIASPSARGAQWMRTRLLVETAARLGCPRHRALSGTPITPDMLCEPGHTLTVHDQIRIMINCARALPDTPLGLEWGQALDAFSRDRLGVWMSAHQNLGRLLDAAVAYQDVLSSPVKGKAVYTETSYRLELHYPAMTDPAASLVRLNNDSMMASFLLTFRQLVQKRFTPFAVHMSHPKPAYADAYQSIFNCPVYFGADITTLELRRADLELPVISHNPANETLYNQLVEREHRAHVQSCAVSVQIHSHLAQLPEQSQTLARVAQALGYSERTLRRKLEQEGVSFRQLQQQVLTDQARDLLARPGMTVEMAAQKLGYSNPSNFRRALRRVAGVSPSDLRDKKGHAPL